MGFQYGIGICEETLRRLSSERSLDDRLNSSWSELDVIEEDDVTPEHYEAISQWKSRYLSRAQFSVNLDGQMERGADQEMHFLASDLQQLCEQVIQRNRTEVEREL
jgi:hypothetical protein